MSARRLGLALALVTCALTASIAAGHAVLQRAEPRVEGKLKRAPDGKMMAVTVTAAGATFEASTPVALFPTRIVGGGSAPINRPQYAVRDGQFLINQLAEESVVSPITLILNWNPDQKK